MSATKLAASGFLAVFALSIAVPSAAQSLYKYRGADGVWVFADRPPEQDQVYEEIVLDRPDSQSIVRLYQRQGDDGVLVLVAENSLHVAVQVAFQFDVTQNLAGTVPTRGNRILDPDSFTDLIELIPAVTDRPIRVEFRYQYVYGHPGARHNPESPYRLPYALANSHLVSQAYPNETTHGDGGSRHAIDFEMPIGTGVYAARAGTIIDVASDFFEAGLDAATFASRANIVRILHADGTIALYGHLNWNSIRVVPGQRVTRGEYIADSGNTGFSSGPHLHFVVQRNAGGAVVSVPVEFLGPGDRAVTIHAGDRPVAY